MKETTQVTLSPVKQKHRALWALGDYPAVATDVIADLGEVLVEACGIDAGDLVLDVAAGSGNAAIPAAKRGATVVASDLTPELLEAGRRTVGGDAHIVWEQADAEALHYGDDWFSVVMSCVGVMFAPDHQASADELVRVVRPGGTIGLISWTPEGFLGHMFATMKPFAPAPPPGAQPPVLWGNPDHVTALFGDRVTDVVARKQTVRIDRFAAPADLRDYFKVRYGPTISVYKAIAGDPEKVASLDRDLVALVERFRQGTDTVVLDWEYLLLTCRRVGSIGC